MESKLLRLPRVLEARGKRKSAHYDDIRRGLWTRGVSIGARATAWPAYEVEAIIAALIAGKAEHEIRELVRRLHEARRTTK